METNKTILIVEDEKSLRGALEEKLGVNGFNIISANNGKDGLMLAIEKHPDLILLDIIMPVMSGMEMIEKLRQDSWGANAKIIVLTNLVDTGKLQKATSFNEGKGIYKYIVKTDIKIEDLVEEIKKMFL